VVCLAGGDRLDRPPRALLEALSLAGNDECCRGIEDCNVAKSAWLAFQNVEQCLCVVLGVAAIQLSRFRTRQSSIFRSHFESADVAVFKRGDSGRASGSYFIKTVRTMYNPNAFGAEVFQHLSHWLYPVLRESADHLALDARRVRKRPEQIEDSTRAELNTSRANIFHRRVMCWCEHETDARITDTHAHLICIEFDFYSKRLQHIGCARFRGKSAVSVFGDRYARACNNKRGARRDVERARGIAAGADHIDGIGRRLNPQHLRAHSSNRAGYLVHGFSAHAQRHQKPAHL